MSRKEDKAIDARIAKAKELAKKLGGNLDMASAVVLGRMSIDLAKALTWMNKKLDQELGEFPDLCFEAASRYGVKYEDLADAYDEQYAGA